MAALRAPDHGDRDPQQLRPGRHAVGGQERARVGEGQRVDAVLDLDEPGEECGLGRGDAPGHAGGVPVSPRRSRSVALGAVGLALGWRGRSVVLGGRGSAVVLGGSRGRVLRRLGRRSSALAGRRPSAAAAAARPSAGPAATSSAAGVSALAGRRPSRPPAARPWPPAAPRPWPRGCSGLGLRPASASSAADRRLRGRSGLGGTDVGLDARRASAAGRPRRSSASRFACS